MAETYTGQASIQRIRGYMFGLRQAIESQTAEHFLEAVDRRFKQPAERKAALYSILVAHRIGETRITPDDLVKYFTDRSRWN